MKNEEEERRELLSIISIVFHCTEFKQTKKIDHDIESQPEL